MLVFDLLRTSTSSTLSCNCFFQVLRLRNQEIYDLIQGRSLCNVASSKKSNLHDREFSYGLCLTTEPLIYMARSLLENVMSLLTKFVRKCLMNNSAKNTMLDLPTEPTREAGSTMNQVQRRGTAATSDSYAEESAAKHTQLIAESAYFAAEKRNFCNGDPIEDWLLAERELSKSTKL